MSPGDDVGPRSCLGGTHGSTLYEDAFASVDRSVALLAYLCGVRLLDAGVIERVVRGDETVCSKSNATLFQRLRGLVALHYQLTDASLSAAGPKETARVLSGLRARLAKHLDLRGSSN